MDAHAERMNRNGESPLSWLSVTTRLGDFSLGFSPLGLRRIEFPQAQTSHAGGSVSREHPWGAGAERALHAALGEGVTQMDAWPPIDWAGATGFQRTVWEELLRIPRGQVKTYGEISRSLKRPGGARAVGRACGANPFPVLVPCHRVIRGDRGLGGFSGGLGWKQMLLRDEGFEVGEGDRLGPCRSRGHASRR